MARSEARLQFSIWDGLKGLSDAGKLLYQVLLTEEYLTQCGRGPILRDIWAARLEWDRSKLDDALAELDDQQFAFVDDSTNEVLVRSFIRGDKVDRQPRVLQAALKAALQVKSPRLRDALAAELRRLDDGTRTGLLAEVVQEALDVADLLDGQRRAAPRPVLVPEPAGPASAGEEKAPPTHCPKHAANPTNRPCRACGAAKDANREWHAARLRAKGDAHAVDARVRAGEKRKAIAACSVCDELGYVGTAVCDHRPRALIKRRAP